MNWTQAVATRYRLHRFSLFSLLLALAVTGAAAGLARADNFVQSFNASSSLHPGWIVSISSKSSTTVVAAPPNGSNSVYGVVIDPSQAPVTVQRQGQQIFVANNGSYPVLVSTQNGPIKTGDYIAVSSIAGIGAKAGTDEETILGRALQAFNGKSDVITSGGPGINIGLITVNISPGSNPLAQSAADIPSPLRRLSESIAGKSVSALRIYASLVIFSISALIAASLLWIGVRSGMTAIGRNPLSRHSIIRSLSQVVVMSVLVFIVGLFAVYLLLKL